MFLRVELVDVVDRGDHQVCSRFEVRLRPARLPDSRFSPDDLHMGLGLATKTETDPCS